MSHYHEEHDFTSTLTPKKHKQNIKNIKKWEEAQLSNMSPSDRKRAMKYIKLKKKFYKLERKIEKYKKYSLVN